jgi:putative hydrolase of HD superfamily
MRKRTEKSKRLEEANSKISGVDIETIKHLVGEGYIPFAEVSRALPWPGKVGEYENDAEHSFALAFVGLALADSMSLDKAKVAQYAIYHDFVERYAGDTSAWDNEGLQTKSAREADALVKITEEFGATPSIAKTIHDYENQHDEEARFVYALDKLMALLMVVQDEGGFWKDANINFQAFKAHCETMLKKVQAHPQVAMWYLELIEQVVANRHKYFLK